MKKKIILIFALLMVALLCLSACNSPSTSDLQKFNALLKDDFSKVTVAITTQTDVAELHGNFTLTFSDDGTNVDYKFERINSFEVGSDGSIANPDGGFIITEEGSVVVREGKVIEGDNSVDLPLDELTVSGFSFKEAFFANATLRNAKFEADVTNPQSFTGNPALVCTDMHVVAIRNVSDNVLTSIELTYTSENGAAVKIKYLFTK